MTTSINQNHQHQHAGRREPRLHICATHTHFTTQPNKQYKQLQATIHKQHRFMSTSEYSPMYSPSFGRAGGGSAMTTPTDAPTHPDNMVHSRGHARGHTRRRLSLNSSSSSSISSSSSNSDVTETSSPFVGTLSFDNISDDEDGDDNHNNYSQPPEIVRCPYAKEGG